VHFFAFSHSAIFVGDIAVEDVASSAVDELGCCCDVDAEQSSFNFFAGDSSAK
jgi:hypothetical protein